MSLTKLQEPDIMSCVNNTIPFVFSSENSITDGFYYTIEFYYYKHTTKIVLLLSKVYPDGDGLFVYDASTILQNYIEHIPSNFNVEDITKYEDNIYNYYYTIYENVGGSVIDTYTGDTLSVFGGVIQYGETFDYTNHYPTSVNSGYTFLSNKENRNYRLDEYATINMFCSDTTIIDKLVIQPKQKPSVPDVNYKYYYDVSTTGNINTYIFPIGPVQLNNMALDGKINYYDIGSPIVNNIISDDDLYYDFWLEDDKGDLLTKKYRVYVENECYGFDETEFLWLGELGTYETFSFRFSNKKSFDIDRNETKRLINSVIDNENTYNIGDRGRKINHISGIETHECKSGWLTTSESNDLMELFMSKDVYVIRDGNIYPVIITDKKVENKNSDIDDLFNFTIKYEMAYKKLSNL